MAATRLAGKLNDACKIALDAVTGVTPYQGRVRMNDSTDFESTIRALTAESECVAITWVSDLRKRPVFTGLCELTVLLFFKLLKDSSSDCNTMYDMVDEIVSELAKDAVWSALGTKVVEVQALRAEDGLQDSVAEWRLVVSLEIPPAC